MMGSRGARLVKKIFVGQIMQTHNKVLRRFWHEDLQVRFTEAFDLKPPGVMDDETPGRYASWLRHPFE